MRKRETGPGPLDGLIKKVVAGIRKKRSAWSRVKNAWKTAAGKRAALHTRPVSLKKATLVVNVDSSGWLYELTLKRKELLGKLNARVKGNKIKNIRFRIGE